jgi:hypothetical protein
MGGRNFRHLNRIFYHEGKSRIVPDRHPPVSRKGLGAAIRRLDPGFGFLRAVAKRLDIAGRRREAPSTFGPKPAIPLAQVGAEQRDLNPEAGKYPEHRTAEGLPG